MTKASRDDVVRFFESLKSRGLIDPDVEAVARSCLGCGAWVMAWRDGAPVGDDVRCPICLFLGDRS